MVIHRMGRLLLLVVGLAVVGGCANNMENAAKILAEREPLRCSFTDREGQVQEWEGPICENIARAKLMNDAYAACADMAQDNEPMCVLAVALTNANGEQQGARTSDDTQLMIAAMNNDTRILSAWISQIPIVGTVTAQYFHSKAESDLQDTLQTAFENSGPNIGSMTVTKSDDGTGGEGAGTGGGGDQIINFGQGSGFATGTGSVVSDGRNPAIIAPGENDSILDPSTVNNQNSSAENNPINNAPVVNPQDNDGGGDNSLIPNLF